MKARRTLARLPAWLRGGSGFGSRAGAPWPGAGVRCPASNQLVIAGCSVGRSLLRLVILLLAVAAGHGITAGPALALKPISVGANEARIEITGNGIFLDRRGDNIQVETAPGPDGLAGRMGVKSSAPGLSPNWIVFALRNATDRPIERWMTAERYNVIGSGIVWPDLDASRVVSVTPSLGFLPDRVKSDRADIFRITLEPGQTVTYVAELASDRMSRVYLWKPLEYELKARERQLFNGILLGITGVLGIFLTAIFAANHKPIFPSAALVTWCVLAYLCVDFGFWHKLFQLRPEDNSIYRAVTESAMAASLLIFLYIFLRLTASHGIARMLLGVWMIAQVGLVAVAVIDARLAATFARVSFAAIGVFGMLTILYLAVRGQDRALSLLPTWVLFLVWVFAASVTLTGRLSGEIVVSGLTAGLVLITVLVGFTVTQFAFRSLEPMFGAAPSEQQVRSLAIDGSGSAVWEWNARREEIKTGELIEMTLGLGPGELSTKVEEFCSHLHEADRERFRLLLWSVQERGGGEIRIAFRMLHADHSFRWFDLEASAVSSGDRRVLRCVGLMRDITEQKRAQDRLLHDAVHDSLTGLPNRELFLDRLGVAVTRARSEPQVVPAVLLVDMDKFKSVNASYGLTFGDSLLLTLARRLQRHLGAQDTLARIGGNQFALLLMQQMDETEMMQFAERIRRALRSPIKLAGQEIVLTGAIGIAVHEPQVASPADLLKEAEVAMYRAKRGGADRVEIFKPQFRTEVDDRITIESELRVALERNQLFVLYQPIIQLSTEELAGYEALVRWKHPRLGLLNPDDFIPVAEESDLIVKLGNFVLTQAAEEAAKWQRILPRSEKPVFVSINVSSRQLFRSDLMKEIKLVIGNALVPPGVLRLEITESLVMENPEQAIEQLEALKALGTGLSLDDFGTGYSSFSYLQRFPFDTIKVDRDLVHASGTDGAGSAIVRSIVALAHELGKKVVAEGVELQSDVGFLRSIGCEYAQGYYYGAAMQSRDVDKMLRQIRKSENKLQGVGLFRTKSQTMSKPKGRKQPGTDGGKAAGQSSATAPGSSRADSQVGRLSRAKKMGPRSGRGAQARGPVVPTAPGRDASAGGATGVPPLPAANRPIPGNGTDADAGRNRMPPPPASTQVPPQMSTQQPPPHPQQPPIARPAPQPPAGRSATPASGDHVSGARGNSAADAVNGLASLAQNLAAANLEPGQPPVLPQSAPGAGTPTASDNGSGRAADPSGSVFPPPTNGAAQDYERHGTNGYANGAGQPVSNGSRAPEPPGQRHVNGAPNGAPNSPSRVPDRASGRPHPDLSTLPPAIAASLAKLGSKRAPPSRGQRGDGDPPTDEGG